MGRCNTGDGLCRDGSAVGRQVAESFPCQRPLGCSSRGPGAHHYQSSPFIGGCCRNTAWLRNSPPHMISTSEAARGAGEHCVAFQPRRQPPRPAGRRSRLRPTTLARLRVENAIVVLPHLLLTASLTTWLRNENSPIAIIKCSPHRPNLLRCTEPRSLGPHSRATGACPTSPSLVLNESSRSDIVVSSFALVGFSLTIASLQISTRLIRVTLRNRVVRTHFCEFSIVFGETTMGQPRAARLTRRGVAEQLQA